MGYICSFEFFNWPKYIHIYILICAGSHWIKLITWYNSNDDYQGISVSWFSCDGRKTKKLANAQLNFWLVMENKKCVLQKPAKEKLKSCFRLADLSKDNALGWKIVLKIEALLHGQLFIFGRSFSLGHCPPLHQPPTFRFGKLCGATKVQKTEIIF